jgi:hypothetical protein
MRVRVTRNDEFLIKKTDCREPGRGSRILWLASLPRISAPRGMDLSASEYYAVSAAWTRLTPLTCTFE